MNHTTTKNSETTKDMSELLKATDKLAMKTLDLFLGLPDRSQSCDLVKDAYIKLLNASRALRNELEEE